ncbi:hypothetical protein [Rhizobium bangladeshense]|uniref:hypothetical protein n=1 Tax=Rhizobium bangladeshense TaxID=1138189 RepID=UPI001C83C939|nr:hypothetical protein [Rhizobium bangladeshense]MBX4896557.1 hypothetical protein [Rhizobium bangladeshense]MBX4900644.1 hypothetical protein [Rhizobium bangladeshense]MBX4912851.1 hypothetical protein [Rhizobium bangladeshense]MBY3617225.1 hypothetical protein [Rhizobium bangladeshense]
MDSARLTYSTFQRNLIFRIAVLAEADFERSIYVEDAAVHIDGRYPASWTATVAVKFKEAGLIDVAATTTDGDLFAIINSDASLAEKLKELSARKENSRPQYVLTESGLQEAENAGRYLGLSLWEEIDKLEASGGSEHVPEMGRIVALDRTSDKYIEVESEVHGTIHKIRSDNELMASDDGAQKVAELEAGKALIQADQVNEGLVKRTLVPALLWAAKKVRDESSGTAIKLAVTKLFDLLT